LKFNHIGIPTTARFDGEIPLPDLQMTVSDHQDNPFGIQWQRYWEGALYPELVKSVPHVAFEMDKLSLGNRFRLDVHHTTQTHPIHDDSMLLIADTRRKVKGVQRSLAYSPNRVGVVQMSCEEKGSKRV
jgi:hypothetical protein